MVERSCVLTPLGPREIATRNNHWYFSTICEQRERPAVPVKSWCTRGVRLPALYISRDTFLLSCPIITEWSLLRSSFYFHFSLFLRRIVIFSLKISASLESQEGFTSAPPSPCGQNYLGISVEETLGSIACCRSEAR